MTRTLDEVAAKLREIPCPRCLTLGAVAIMRCEGGPGECEYLANCPYCGYTFDLELATQILERLKQETRVVQRIDPCPHCGAHQAEIHFACDTPSHGCFFVATCGACQRTFRIPVTRW